MAVLRNRYHEAVWFLGRKKAEPDETIEVPDAWVEERDEDGVLVAGLDPDDLYWERVDGPGLTRAEFDGVTEGTATPDAPAPAAVAQVVDAPAESETHPTE